MTKNKRRNEKRKQDKAVAPSNMYDALPPADSEDLPAKTDEFGVCGGLTEEERRRERRRRAAVAALRKKEST